MRTRKGPLVRINSGYKPADTTVVVLTCIPTEGGYYEERFDVVKACLASILKHTDADYDLMVIDNGSIPAVTDHFLQLNREGYIHHLVLNSRNVGLSGALNIAFNAAPGKYIAFSNDDVFFHPNWLSAHLQILETFPKVGLVSGQLISGPDRQDEVVDVAAEYGIDVSEFCIPDSWLEQFAQSVGQTLEQFLKRPYAQRNRHTYLLEKDGCKAFSGKTGYAHVFCKEVLQSLQGFPYTTGYLAGDSPDRQLAHAIRNAGFLWLCTFRKTTEHMGNRLNSHWREKLERYGLSSVLGSGGGIAALPRGRVTHANNLVSKVKIKFTNSVVRHRFTQWWIDKAIHKLIELRY